MGITKLYEYIDYQLSNFPQEHCIGHFVDGNLVKYSTAEVVDLAKKIASGLLKSGIRPGDKIGMVSYKNRPEWVIMDLAMLQIGVINVPVYPTISSKEYDYIFNDSEIKACIVGDGDLYDKVKKAQETVPTLQTIYTFDKRNDLPFWMDLVDDSRFDEIEAIKSAIDPEKMAILIYTSGTTGEPKGVMLSHHNIVSNINAVRPLIPIMAGQKTLSFLPMCHVFERVVSYAYLYIGANVTFVGTDNLGGDEGDLKKVKPHFFTTVPRLLEKVYEKIYNKGLALTGIKKGLFFWALSLTDDFEYDTPYSGFKALKMKIADKLIFSKWREALGGNVIGIITGAAQCPEKIAKVFSAAGIPVREGYGMTETSPAISITRFDKGYAKLGTVGPAIDGVEILIDTSEGEYRSGEGEILATGPNIMLGYYKKEDKTAEMMKVINGKTFIKTGDVGTIVTGANGVQFLKITDRKKELMKTSGGKYVAPSPIEGKFKEDFLIEQIMVVGDNQKFVTALIIPAVEALKEWCSRHEIEWTTLEAALKEPKVIEKYRQRVEKHNEDFGHIDKVKEFSLLATTWDPAKSDGSEAELTPTMKLKRRVIMQKHSREIAAMYAEK